MSHGFCDKYKVTHTYCTYIRLNECFLSPGFCDDEISRPYMFRLLCCRAGNSTQPSTDNLRLVASDYLISRYPINRVEVPLCDPNHFLVQHVHDFATNFGLKFGFWGEMMEQKQFFQFLLEFFKSISTV